jgi:acetyl-CoA synthetase
MIMITPLPEVVDTKPGSATFAGGRRHPRQRGASGCLVLRKPWPAMLCGIYGHPERYKETYWSRFQGLFFAGV